LASGDMTSSRHSSWGEQMSKELQRTLGWRLTGHARAAAAARGFSIAEVLTAAAEPGLRYTSYSYGEGREVRCLGTVCAVVHARTKTVITVLWHHDEAWTDDQVRQTRLVA
jgi:hypothetical protein